MQTSVSLVSNLKCVCVCVCVYSSRVYMADLESALTYSLRVELSGTPVFKGEALSALKGYIAVLAKVGLTSTVLCGRVQYTTHRP